MLELLIPAVLLLACLGSAVVAGIFFAFSSFIMRALARIPAGAGLSAMQEINVTVLNPGFFAVFFGTGALSLITLVLAACRFDESGAAGVVAASLLYLAGCLLVTILFNVPRNEALARLAVDDASAVEQWRRYLVSWTRWNHVRTVCSFAAAVLFGASVARGVLG